MSKLWMVLVLLALAGCGSQAIKQMEPTAIQFGDSNSLGAAGVARLKLNGTVDFRHDPWDKGGIAPSDTPYFYGKTAGNGFNNGACSNMLMALEQQLQGTHYTVLVMNAGIHDAQLFHDGVETGPIPIPSYRNCLEAAAQEAEQHADYVIWVNTTPIPASSLGAQWLAGSEKPYNTAADAVAKEHGFYVLETDAEGQKPANVHFTSHGYDLLGTRIADCVMTVLNQIETAVCHK